MKKTYIIPETLCVNVIAENMLAASAELFDSQDADVVSNDADILVRENETAGGGLWD